MAESDSKSSGNRASGEKRSGRVTHDARGNPVWEWQVSTGVFEKDASTQSLKKLEAKGLSLMDTQSVTKQSAAKSKSGEAAGKQADAKLPVLPGGGVNPYDNSGRASSTSSSARAKPDFDATRHHPALAHKQQPMRKEPPRQSLQTKYHGRPEGAKKKSGGLLSQLKSVLGVKE